MGNALVSPHSCTSCASLLHHPWLRGEVRTAFSSEVSYDAIASVDSQKEATLVKSAIESSGAELQSTLGEHPELKSVLQRMLAQRLSEAKGPAEAVRFREQLPAFLEQLGSHWKEDPLAMRMFLAQSAHGQMVDALRAQAAAEDKADDADIPDASPSLSH